jgi:dephospho-CoA kinase
MNEETEQRTAGYITLPLAVLDGWVGQNAQYLKWWTQLRREASWTGKTVWHNRQQVYLQARQVIVTVNSLVKQWQVSKPTVIHFLQRLESEKLIERQTDSRKTIITITPLGWADSEVKQEVASVVKVEHDVDHQSYHQPLPPIINNKEKNIIASGVAHTREEEVANRCEMEEVRCLKDNNKDSFDEIVAFFNEKMKGKGIQQVAIITSERRQAFERLMSQTGVNKDTLKQAIKNAAESDFLNGKGPKGWVASFDWMMVPQNFQKVLENNYRNKPVIQQVQYGTTDGYQDPRRGVEASRTSSYASGYDRPL